MIVEGDNDTNTRNKKLIFKNNTPFRSSISKIRNTCVGNLEDLDFFILMNNLLEYSNNYSMTSGSLWNYYIYELSDDANEKNDGNNKEHPNDNSALDTRIVLPLKLISKFWRFINLLLINCEIELNWSCSKECIMSEISITLRIAAHPDASSSVPGVTAIQTSGEIFQINNAKL